MGFSWFLLKQIFAGFRNLKKLLFFEEFEVFFGDSCDDVGEAEAVDSDDDDTVGFVVFYLTGDVGEWSVDDTYLSAWFEEGIIVLPVLSLVIWVVTYLGLDEVLHVLIGHREDDRLFVFVTLWLRHKLQ